MLLLVELVEFLKDALERGLLISRHGCIGFVVHAVGVGRDEVMVEQVDDRGIGERTRSHGGGAASAALQCHGMFSHSGPAIAEEEDWAVVFLGQADSVAND